MKFPTEWHSSTIQNSMLVSHFFALMLSQWTALIRTMDAKQQHSRRGRGEEEDTAAGVEVSLAPRQGSKVAGWRWQATLVLYHGVCWLLLLKVQQKHITMSQKWVVVIFIHAKEGIMMLHFKRPTIHYWTARTCKSNSKAAVSGVLQAWFPNTTLHLQICWRTVAKRSTV